MLEQFFLNTGRGTCSELFLDLLNMSISASYVIVAVIIARVLLRKAPKRIRCFLWMLVAIRLICPVTIESVFSLLPTKDVIETEIVYNQKPQIHSGITIVDRPINQYMEKHLSSKEVNSVNPLQIVVMFISIAWVIGMIVMLGFLIYSWIRIKNQVKTAIPKDVAGVRIYQSEQIATPFLFGLIKPKIYIPFSVEEDDLTYVVLHEQAHYRRCDYLIKPIAYILLMIYWFQPLLWVAYVLLCRDIELACDELVIRESDKEQSFRKMYSQALLSCAVNRKMISACPIAFGEVGVKTRVKNVLNYKRPTFWMLVVIVVVCIAIPLCFMTHKKEDSVVAKQQEWSEEIQAQELTVLEQQIEEIEIQKKAEIDQLNQMRKILAAKKSELTGKIDVEAPGAEQQLQLLEERFEELEAMLQQMESDITGIKEISQNENTSYIEQWAEAFCNRDGETIALMAAEDAESSLVERGLLVYGNKYTDGEDYVAFGYSSPWPWGSEEGPKNYKIIDISENVAIILYYAWTSEPHITVWQETLTYKMQNDRCVITAESLECFEYICDLSTFEKAYEGGIINETMMDYVMYNGAGEALNKNALNNRDSIMWYERLFEPETAAVQLLNLLDNENKVSLRSEGDKATGSVYVHIYFVEDGKSATICMEQPYGTSGIWVPQNVPALKEEKTGDAGYNPLMINEQNYDGIMNDSMKQLQEWFPNYYDEQEQTTQYADLNLDGYEEMVSMKNLGYNGGDGGYLITVIDGKTQKEIELPNYDKETGFPFYVEYGADDAENSFYIVKMDNDEIAKISVSAVCKKYEQEGEFVYFKERFLSEALTGILTGDAASGFCIIQENDGERPTLIVKTYLSGVEGHSDCIGYAMTKLRLQDDGTWNETYQFLPV